MTKAELVARIAEEAQITQAQTTKALNSFVEILIDEVKTTGNFALAGLGSFVVSNRAARAGINPRTKEPIKIPASKTVRFRSAKALKDAVNV